MKQSDGSCLKVSDRGKLQTELGYLDMENVCCLTPFFFAHLNITSLAGLFLDQWMWFTHASRQNRCVYRGQTHEQVGL